MDEMVSEAAMGLKIFDQFVFGGQLTTEERMSIVEESIRIGKQRAEQVRKEFGNQEPVQILSDMGIRIVEEKERKTLNLDYVKLAEFYVKAGEIRLNADALERIGEKIDSGLAKKIILSHELYHFFEITRWGRTADLFVKRVRLFGWIPVKRKMLPAAEIAADSFAKAYLGLSIHPRIIEAYYFESN